MNERLITDLLVAYRDCPADADQLRRHRIVLADALEEAGDVRAEAVKEFRVLTDAGTPALEASKGKMPHYWINPSYDGRNKRRYSTSSEDWTTADEAESAIRSNVLELFDLEKIKGWQVNQVRRFCNLSGFPKDPERIGYAEEDMLAVFLEAFAGNPSLTFDDFCDDKTWFDKVRSRYDEREKAGKPDQWQEVFVKSTAIVDGQPWEFCKPGKGVRLFIKR